MSRRPVADLREVRSQFDRTGSLLPARRVVIFGAGGHGRELADIVNSIGEDSGAARLVGFVDDAAVDESLLARSGHRFLGSPGALDGRDCDVQIGVGDPSTRARIDRRLAATAAALIHPTAQIGSDASLRSGAVLAQGVIVTTNVTIGRHSHLNVGTSISHDCVIGDHVTICPGVRLTGNVTVGDRAFIGAAATVLPGVSIGHDAIVGAGALVRYDVPPGITVAGVPARRI